MSTETRKTIEAKIARLEASALRNLEAVEGFTRAAVAAKEAADEVALKEARKDRELAWANHHHAAKAADALRLSLATVEG